MAVAAAVTDSAQVPAPTTVTVVPETVQMLAAEVVPKVKAGLGTFDVALSVKLPAPGSAAGGTVAPNWMTCAAGVTVKLCWTWVAAE